MAFQLEEEYNGNLPVIKVIGVGGGGGNAVNRMINSQVRSVEFIAINTDDHVLQASKADRTIHIGAKLTRGKGAGSQPAIGERAAIENSEEIEEALKDTDMVFITAGMGGGTGTGAAPIVAKIAREMGILTVAIVTKPFAFAGKHRMQQAELKQYVDSLVIVPNEKLKNVSTERITLKNAFEIADDVLRQGVQSISDLILIPGDMVIREQDDYRPMLNLVSSLSGIAPCYGVLGNHESERIYYRDDQELPGKFRDAGLKLLRNATEEVRIGNDVIQLIGVEGSAHGFEAYGGREFMDKTVINPSAYSILMTHVPILFEPQLAGYDFDLGIAGHVHGGIVNLPFAGGLYSDEEGFFPRFTAGEYTLQNQQKLIVSAGLGDSKPFPPRINNMPELVVIDIDRY